MINKKYILFFTFCYLCLFNMNKIIETNRIKYESSNKYSVCEYSDEYKEWLKLNDEEKANSIMPKVCKRNVKEENNSLLPKTYSFNTKGTHLSKFDLRNVGGKNYVTSIKNQKNTGTCWAFSTMASIESNLLKNTGNIYDFSELHESYYTSRQYFTSNIINTEGYNVTAGNGGNPWKSSSYLTKLAGPVFEGEVPFDTYYDGDNTASSNNYLKSPNLNTIKNIKPVVDVNNININTDYTKCTDSALDHIKTYLENYGALQANFYYSSSYDKNGYYYYNGGNSINHAITIIGWDDSISKTKFTITPSRDGAFIIKNSWGTSFGDSGYYYISYDDAKICSLLTEFNDIDFEIEDNVYYHDTLGWNASFNLNSTTGPYTMYAASKFTKKTSKKEVLTEVTIGTYSPTNYELFISKTNDLTNLQSIQKGIIDHQGYGTIKLNNPIVLDNDFTIMVKYTTSTADGVLPIQIYGDNLDYIFTSIDANKSFISIDGTNWDDAKTVNGGSTAIPSIKAYTNNINYDYTLGTVTKLSYPLNSFNLPVTISNIDDPENISTQIIDSTNADVTSSFIINNTIKSNGIINIIKNSSSISSGTYKVKTTYKYISYETTIDVTNDSSTISLGSLSYIPTIKYNNENKIYNNSGGTINVPVTTTNLGNEELTVKITNSSSVVQSFTVNNKTLTNNVTTLSIIIPTNTSAGTYTIEVSHGSIKSTQTFIIYSYVPSTSITLKYNNTILSGTYKLLKNDTLSLTTTLSPTTTTVKDIVFTSSDESIATISSTGIITALKAGSTTIKATNGMINKSITINVIDTPTSSVNTTLNSNLSNTTIDKKYGGTFVTNISFTNLTNTNINANIESYPSNSNLYIENKDSIAITNNNATITIKYLGNNTISSGSYKVNYSYILDDIKNTTISNSYSINIVDNIPTTKVELNTSAKDILVDETFDINSLGLNITPSNATNKRVTYNPIDSSIVSVTSSGIVKGLKKGSTIINVISADDSTKSTQLQVNVTGTSYDFSIGTIKRLTTPADSYDFPIALTNISDPENISVEITNSSSVGVTSSFTIKNDISTKSNINITKNNIDLPTGIYNACLSYKTISYCKNIEINGETGTINFGTTNYVPTTKYNNEDKIYDKSGGTVNIPITTTNIINKELSVKITNSSNVIQNLVVNNKTLTNNTTTLSIIIPANTVSGIYTIEVSYEGVKSTTTFTINKFINTTALDIKYNDKSLSGTYKLLKDDTLTLSSIITPNDSTIKDIIWNSSDKSVATISNTGVITPIKVGATTISVTNSTITKSIIINVIDRPTSSVITTKNSTLGNENIDNKYGGTFTNSITFSNATNSTKLYSEIENISNNSNFYIENIDNILINNNKSSLSVKYNGANTITTGSYKINYWYFLDDIKSSRISNSYTINIVDNIPMTRISTSISSKEIDKDATFDINDFTITIEPNNVTNKTLLYSSNDKSIATISPAGIVTGIKKGETDIKIYSQDNPSIYKLIHIIINDSDYANFSEQADILNKEDTNYLTKLTVDSNTKEFNYNKLLTYIDTDKTLKVYKNDNSTLLTESDLIGTGSILEVGTDKYTLIIKGDITGDGKVNIGDLARMYNFYKKNITMEPIYLISGDLNLDNNVNISDLAKMYNYYKGNIPSL